MNFLTISKWLRCENMKMILKGNILTEINFFSIIVILLFNGYGASNNLFVFNINVGISYVLVLALQTISLLIFWSYKKVKIDIIAGLLYIQVVIYTVSLIVFPDAFEGSMKYYVAVLLSLVIYIFAVSASVDLMNKKILFLSEGIITILSLQTVSLTFRAIKSNIPYYMMKNYIQAPIGGTNYIGSFLLMFLVLVIGLEEKKLKKIFFVSLAILGIVLTRSTGAFILMILIFVHEYGKRVVSVVKFKELIKYSLIIIIFIIVSWKLLGAFPDYFERFTINLHSIFLGESEAIDVVSNGRISTYTKALEMISESPILGYGLNYRNGILGMAAHNLILDQFLKAGLLNVMAFISIIYIMLYKFYKYRNISKEIKTIGKMVVVVMINGMYEPNLGGVNFDFFFWLFCGVGMANCYCVKVLRNNTSGVEMSRNL